jgi:hypothetical protein
LNTWPALGYYRVDMSVRFTTRTGSGFNTKQYWVGFTYHNLARNDAPNGVATLAITMKPTFTGTVFVEAEMIKLHQFWFGRYLYHPTQFAWVNATVS